MRPTGPRSSCSIGPRRPRGGVGARVAAASVLAAMAIGEKAPAGDDLPGAAPALDAPQLDAPAVPQPVAAPVPGRPVIVSTPVAPRGPAAVPAPTPAPSVGRPGGGAVLAIPGLTAPARPTAAPLPAPLPGAPASGSEGDGSPSLDAPVGMKTAPPGPTRTEVVPDARAGRSAGRPVITLDEEGPDEIVGATPPAGPSTRRTPSSPSTAKRIEPTPRATTTTPQRRRFFGLLPVPPAVARTASTGVGPDPDRAIARDDARPADKPAAGEAAERSALRARIEKQARLQVGERARNVEVEVDGRNATVRATGVKFYQKRAVRRSLETLPALAGLRSTIEVLD